MSSESWGDLDEGWPNTKSPVFLYVSSLVDLVLIGGIVRVIQQFQNIYLEI